LKVQIHVHVQVQQQQHLKPVNGASCLVTNVTVTEALVLRHLLEDRGRITESIRILVPVDRMEQKCFQIAMKRVRRSQQFQLRR